MRGDSPKMVAKTLWLLGVSKIVLIALDTAIFALRGVYAKTLRNVGRNSPFKKGLAKGGVRNRNKRGV